MVQSWIEVLTLWLVLADESNHASGPSVAQIAVFDMQVLRKPFVMPALRAVLVAHVDNEPDSIAAVLCDFLLQLTLAREHAEEVAQHDDAQAMIVAVSQALPSAAGLQPDAAATAQARLAQVHAAPQEVEPRTVMRWPGNRHDNDHKQYRRVRVLPTPDEVSVNTKPAFLPVADGGDEWLRDQVIELATFALACCAHSRAASTGTYS